MDTRYLFGIMALAIVKVSSEDQPDGSGNEVAPQQEKSDNQSGNSLARFLLLHRRQASQFLRRQSWVFSKKEGEKEKEKAEDNDEEVVETMCEQAEREYREPSETAHENNPYFQEHRREGKAGQVKTKNVKECKERSSVWGK